MATTPKTDPAPDDPEVQAEENLSEPPPPPTLEAEPTVKVLRALCSLTYLSTKTGDAREVAPDDLLQDVSAKDAARFVELKGAEWAHVHPSELTPKD
jgi:hypothetical protein